MKTLLIGVLLAWLSSATAHAADLCSGPAAKTGGQIRTNVCAALAAINRMDAPALGALMANDFALFAASGKYYPNSKIDMVARWTAPNGPPGADSSMLVEIDREYLSGDVGFLAGEIEDRTIEAGQNRCYRHAFTDIWERRSGAWRWVQSHESGAREVSCGK